MAFILLLSNNACKKDESNELSSAYLFKVFPDKTLETVSFIREVDNNCFLLISNGGLTNYDDIQALIIYKINANGQVLWRKQIPNLIMNNPTCAKLPDGSTLISPAQLQGNLIQIDKEGNVLFTTNFSNYNEFSLYSPPLPISTGGYLIGDSKGNSQVNSDNKIHKVGADKLYKGAITIKDSSLNCKVLYMNVYNYESEGIYYLSGSCFQFGWKNFNAITKLFIAKQTYAGDTLKETKCVILDSSNTSEGAKVYTSQIYTTDNFLLIASNHSYRSSGYRGRVTKIDKSLQVVWQKEIATNSTFTNLNGMEESVDGNYIVVGSSRSNEKASPQPFACKLDKNGNIIWYKVYSTGLNGGFEHGILSNNGAYYFGGWTNGFSQGQNYDDAFIIRDKP